MTKQCKKCRQTKPLPEFHKNKTKRDGHHSYCKECATQNSKEWYQANKGNDLVKSRLSKYGKIKRQEFKDAIDALKHHLGCCICGEDDSCCLDFHHLDDQGKDKDVSFWRTSKSIKGIVTEISKCACVCSNCHRKIHAGRILSPSQTVDSLWVESKLADFGIKRRWHYTDRIDEQLAL